VTSVSKKRMNPLQRSSTLSNGSFSQNPISLFTMIAFISETETSS
jgi:hypothetical protein